MASFVKRGVYSSQKPERSSNVWAASNNTNNNSMNSSAFMERRKLVVGETSAGKPFPNQYDDAINLMRQRGQLRI